MNTSNISLDCTHDLQILLAAALAADIPAARLEDLIRAERHSAEGTCPECGALLFRSNQDTLRCSSCGVTTAAAAGVRP